MTGTERAFHSKINEEINGWTRRVLNKRWRPLIARRANINATQIIVTRNTLRFKKIYCFKSRWEKPRNTCSTSSIISTKIQGFIILSFLLISSGSLEHRKFAGSTGISANRSRGRRLAKEWRYTQSKTLTLSISVVMKSSICRTWSNQ